MRWTVSMITAAAMSAAVLCAQKAPAPAPAEPAAAAPQGEMESAVIPVKTLTGDSFRRLVGLLNVFVGAHLSGDDKLRTIVVYAPKDVIAQIRQVVDQLDRPGSEAAIGRNIDMTMSFLLCSTKAPNQSSPLPADIEPVAKQLRAATPYKDFQLLDVVPLRLQEGKATIESWRIPGAVQGTMYPDANVQIQPESVIRKGNLWSVRFSQLRIDLTTPLQNTTNGRQNQRIDTAGEFLEGQKTVLGKISGVEEGSAIFVVISVKVLD